VWWALQYLALWVTNRYLLSVCPDAEWAKSECVAKQKQYPRVALRTDLVFHTVTQIERCKLYLQVYVHSWNLYPVQLDKTCAQTELSKRRCHILLQCDEGKQSCAGFVIIVGCCLNQYFDWNALPPLHVNLPLLFKFWWQCLSLKAC